MDIIQQKSFFYYKYPATTTSTVKMAIISRNIAGGGGTKVICFELKSVIRKRRHISTSIAKQFQTFEEILKFRQEVRSYSLGSFLIYSNSSTPSTEYFIVSQCNDTVH